MYTYNYCITYQKIDHSHYQAHLICGRTVTHNYYNYNKVTNLYGIPESITKVLSR